MYIVVTVLNSNLLKEYNVPDSVSEMRQINGVWTCLRQFMTSSVRRNYAFVNQTDGLVTVDKFKAVTILSINRPDKQNAMNEALLHELAAQFTRFEEDDSASVVVVHGTGGNFSIGYDIDELKQKCEHDDSSVRNSFFLPFRRKSCKPFLCSISGQCKSIGFEIALMCDIRYVEEKSILGFDNRKLGIPLVNEGPKRLANLIGISKAIDCLLMDRQITAHEAVDLGIANGVVQDGTALGSAMKTAVYLSSLPQSALQHDFGDLYGLNLDEFHNSKKWESTLNDIKSYVNLDVESRKTARINKLHEMSDWELKEIEYEKQYEMNKIDKNQT